MLKIVIDTREQTPWHFPENQAEVSRGTIPAGDYALLGDNGFAIERKSLDDFVGTISSGWERFLRELKRMKHFPSRIIIVESDFRSICFRKEGEDIVGPDHNHYKISPNFVLARISQLAYAGVAVLFAGNSEFAAVLAWRILLERQHEKEGITNEVVNNC